MTYERAGIVVSSGVGGRATTRSHGPRGSISGRSVPEPDSRAPRGASALLARWRLDREAVVVDLPLVPAEMPGEMDEERADRHVRIRVREIDGEASIGEDVFVEGRKDAN